MDTSPEVGHGGNEMERKTRHGSGAKRGSSPSHTDLSYPSVKTSWSITAMRGKVTKRCLWVACKAVTMGILLIIIGSGMATVGYYSDQLSTVEERRGNTTVLVKNQNTDSHLSSLTYIGPAVMGVGGFIILASCVMTCEARDTAAKIVPVWFRKMRVHAVAGAEAVPGAPTRRTRWERFLAQSAAVESGSGSASHESSRSAIATALVNFSKYLQNSFDLAKIADKASENKDKLHKCPSEPTFPRDVEREALLSTNDNFLKPPFPEIIVPAETSATSSKPVPLNLAVQMYRQAKSVDCPRRDDAPFPKPESSPVELVPPVSLQHPAAYQRALYDVNQQVSRSDSNGSMAMDIHLPDGSVTVRVKDENRSANEPSLPSRQNSSRQSSYSSTTGPEVPPKRDHRSSRNRLTPSRDEGSSELSSPLLRVPTETAPPSAILCRPRSRERRDSTHRRHPLLRQTAIDTAEHESDAV